MDMVTTGCRCCHGVCLEQDIYTDGTSMWYKCFRARRAIYHAEALLHIHMLPTSATLLTFVAA